MASLYATLLGADFLQLHPALQRFYESPNTSWRGTAHVQWSKYWLLRILLCCTPLPREGKNIALQFRLIDQGKETIWDRDFGGRRTASHQLSRSGTLVERFGPISIDLHTHVAQGKLALLSSTFRMLGIPLPAAFGLHTNAEQWVADQRLHFDVRLHWHHHLLVRYTGYLQEP